MMMSPSKQHSGILFWILFFLACLCPGILITSVYGADVSIGPYYLGDTIPLHGESYIGDRVYLFLTGPDLPANGVTLTDVTQRADQGQFTIVDLNNNQEWSMNWNTKRIKPNIKPGTYTVYISSQPVDLSHLGGPKTYKTIAVYFSDPVNSEISISTGTSYSLNPEEHVSTVSPPVIIPSPTPTPAPPTTVTTIPPTPLVSVNTPAQKTAALPLTAVLAVFGWGYIIGLFQQNRR